MTVVRLDRHGLTANIADDAALPQLRLPRAARVLCAGETLCELRLVPRALVRAGGPSLELTMQPSRIDDDLSFWQALYARRHLYPDVPARGHQADDRPNRSGEAWRLTQREISSAESASVGTCSHAAFKLPTANEALFFSEWLEFHFAELAAHARAMASPSNLLELDRRRTDATVNVAFTYRYSCDSVHRATDELCARIAQEAEQCFGVCSRYELLNEQKDVALPDGRLRSVPSAWQPGRHSN
ncbi:hypothetical protein [Trinickia sp. EG282A]|uniref:hypothetical protein n=1 Tax=Trinickia sp. EG282A TaxID=3237013 RepID=UPI0034D276C1